MTVTVIREQEVLREAMEVLWKHLDPARAVRLWATWQMGDGDHLSLRDQLFEGEGMLRLSWVASRSPAGKRKHCSTQT